MNAESNVKNEAGPSPTDAHDGPLVSHFLKWKWLYWHALDERIGAFDKEFIEYARHDEYARRLITIPGIGALNATALVAAVGDARTFARGRDLAAWLGLVPRQETTGGKPRLLGITKRGSKSSQNADPGRPIRHADVAEERHEAGRLAAWTAVPGACQYCGRSARRQDGAHSLGAAASRADLRSRCCGGLNEIGRQYRAVLRCLRVVRGRWPDSRPVSWNPMAQNGASTPAPL